MKKNMGTADRVIRLAIALVAGVLFLTGTVTGALGIILVAVGGIFALTSFVSFCPLYAPFGISSCSVSERSESAN